MRHTDRVLCGIVSLFALAAGPLAHADDAVTLAHTYKEGDSMHYKLKIKVSANENMNVVVTTTGKYQVKTVKPNGDVVMSIAHEGGTLDLGSGQPQNIPATPPTSVTLDKSGKLTAYKDDMPDESYMSLGMQQLIETVHNIILPGKPVKPDDTWETEMDDPAVKGKKMTIKDTYLGTEKREGASLWKIKQTVEAQTNDNGDKTTIELTAFLDPKTGQEVYEEGSCKNVPTQAYGPLSWTEEVTLLKDDDAKKTDTDSKKPSP